MAEEIKTTSAGDSVPDKSVVGSSSQGEEQDTHAVEERETGADGAIVPDEKMVDENEIDAKPANKSDDEELKKEVEGKTATSVEPETGEIVEGDDKGEDESQAEEKEEIDAKKADEKDLPAEGKREVSSAKETQAEMSLNEAEAEDKEKNRKEEGQEVTEEKAEEKVGGEVEEKAEEGTEEEVEEKVEKKAEGKEEENVEGKAEEGLSEVEATNQSESEEKEVVAEGDAGAEENSGIKIEENLAKEEAVVGVEPSLVSSEELVDKKGEGVTDEEWISWKSEFVNKFNKRFDRKWIISGIGIVVLIVGLVIFFKVPGFRSTDSWEVRSLQEIAGPVYDMKFFLPLAVGSGETRFVKVTVAIELMDKGFRKEIDKKISDLREEVINLVLTKSPKEVRSSHGKEMLKKAITNSLNKHFSKNCIKNTYFTELVVL